MAAERDVITCEVCGERAATHRRGHGFDNHFVCGQCIPDDAPRDDGGTGPLFAPPPFNGRPELVYVAGPLTTSGLVWHNVRRALIIADALMRKGHVPFVPHLSAVWAMCTSEAEHRTEEQWMEYCLSIVDRCNSLFRFPGRSRGADREHARAMTRGKRIYHELEAVPIVSKPAEPVYPLLGDDPGPGSCNGCGAVDAGKRLHFRGFTLRVCEACAERWNISGRRVSQERCEERLRWGIGAIFPPPSKQDAVERIHLRAVEETIAGLVRAHVDE